MAETMCRSADGVLQTFLASSCEATSHHRMVQQSIKCGFGLDGVCCRLCANGPCRLSKARPYGVCGADADTIAGRNFLRAAAAGAGCYLHVAENTARRLRELAERGGPFRGPAALDRLCSLLGVPAGDPCARAKQAAACILEDLNRPYEENMALLERLSYPPRYEAWKSLGLLPGGAKNEVFNAVVKTSTNLSSDPADMLMQCLRLGIATGLYGLRLTNLINDVIMGEGEIRFEPVGMRTIDPDCVNIMVTGHQVSMFGYLSDLLRKPEIASLAQQAGAKGFQLVGCTCVGQDFQVRSNQHCGVFCGHAGNNYTSEAVLLTGCVDLVLSEFNCTIPGLEPICDRLDIPMICLDDVAKKKSAACLPYSEADKEQIAVKSLAAALAAYQKRTAAGARTNPMAGHGCKEAVTGVTEITLLQLLGGSYEPLIKALASGAVKGVAAVVGCSNLRAQGHDVLTVEMTRELIKKDILVLAAGCTCGGLENCGLMSREAAQEAGTGLRALCNSLGIPPVLNFGPCLAIGRIETVAAELAGALGVDLPKLPVVVSAPQWLEEQALADGCFALALGFHLHLGLPPFVTGSPLIVDTLTSKLPALTGGRLIIEAESRPAADRIEAVILEKRKELGLH